MRIASKLSGSIAAVMLAISLAGAAPAQAAVASSITIHWNATAEAFHGKVTSANSECIAHRKVKVLKKTASGPQLVGTTTSNNKGGWSVSVMAHSGHYFARTPAQTIMSTHCGGARSTTIDVM